MKDSYTRAPKLPPGATWERFDSYEYQDELGRPKLVVLRDHGKYADGKPVIDEETGKRAKQCIHNYWGTPGNKKPPGARKLIYKLPDIIKEIKAGKTIVVVEGEIKVTLLRHWGFAATCCPGGWAAWEPEHAELLRGAYRVLIVPDNDDVGRRFADKVGRTLEGVVPPCYLLELPNLPERGDVCDWQEAGGTKEQFAELAEQARPWEPYGPSDDLPESQWLGEKPATGPPALIKGVLPQTGVAVIGGQSGGGKTFHAIHLSTCLLPDCNREFYIDKYRIKRHGGVLYLVLEGKLAFHMRVTAAFEAALGKQRELWDKAKLPFSWNTYEPNLFANGPDALIKLAERDAAKMRRDFGVELVAVFLDTMGLAACYENEDRAAQVQKVISGLSHLSDVTGALAIGVDHFGKDQQAGLRGSSAKRGHVETILACLVDRDANDNPINHRLKFEKIRDGEEGRIVPYRLNVVDWGIDEDGEQATTCVVQWEPNRPPPAKPQRRAPKRHKTDVTLERAIRDVGLPADPDALRSAFYQHHGGTKRAANTAWHRAVNAAGLALNNGKLEYAL